MVLESDETRAGFSKEEQGADLQMVKTFILRPEGPRAAPTGFRLALRSPNLMKEHKELRFGGIPGLGDFKSNIISQQGGVAECQGGRRGTALQS